MAGPRTVTLTWHEQYLAAQVGVLRHFRARRDGRADAHGLEPRDGAGIALHIDGAMGEMALAKALNLYWDGSVDTFHTGADVGPLHVRTRSRPTYQLLIRDTDPPRAPFVLVRGSGGVYHVVGWAWSDEARRAEWRSDYGGRVPAYFVPDSALRDLATLPLFPLYSAKGLA